MEAESNRGTIYTLSQKGNASAWENCYSLKKTSFPGNSFIAQLSGHFYHEKKKKKMVKYIKRFLTSFKNVGHENISFDGGVQLK